MMRNIEFRSPNGESLRGFLFEPPRPGPNPALIFVHGLLSTHAEFGDYPEKFSELGYVALAIDLRGHGESGGMSGFITEERMVEDVRQAVDFVIELPGVDSRRVALLGHSLGAAAVLCAAAEDPRVHAVVAGATVGRLRDEIGRAEFMLYRLIDGVNRLQRLVTRRSIYVPYRVSYKDMFFDPRARAAAEAKGFLRRALPADIIPPLLKQDACACAKELRVPTLIVVSEHDRLVKQANIRRVYDLIPGEKDWYEVKGSGHSFATDCASAEAFDTIKGWLDTRLGGGR
jgi:pimeloyl-ACP methyl ester carboxylesterase